MLESVVNTFSQQWMDWYQRRHKPMLFQFLGSVHSVADLLNAILPQFIGNSANSSIAEGNQSALSVRDHTEIF